MKKELKKFHTLNWDFNHDTIEHYDVLPYLRLCIKARKDTDKKAKKSKRMQKMKEENPADYEMYWAFPETYEKFVKFIDREAMHQFWGRCEYEMICQGWPVPQNDYKLDVYEQIKMNLDVICKILWEEIK